MGIIKKILGIKDLEEKYDKKLHDYDTKIGKIREYLKTSWSWVNYLHELEQDNKKRIEHIEGENKELKSLIKEINEKRKLTKDIKEKVKEEAEKPEPESEPELENEIELKKIDIRGLGKKEAFILQILYKMASFDVISSLSTSGVYKNLPYDISKRGLRKKLYKLEELGLISSIKRGRARKWYLDMVKLEKLKSFLKTRNKTELKGTNGN